MMSEILNKANIGLWAFELDEGKAPRMYVDEKMLGLLGLTEQLSPEETYHAWYDHVDSESYGLVADAVEKMTAGEHAEVQYPWHGPDGQTMTVRCGGVRNFDYKDGVRIEGTHQDVTKLTHLQDTMFLGQKAFNQYFLEPYEAAYYVNIENRKWQVFKRTNEMDEKYPVLENRFNVLQKYINTEIHPDDRERVAVAVRPDTIKKILETQPSYSCTYRKISEAKERLLQCVILRGADEKHFVLGFKDVSEEERQKKEFEIAVSLANQQRQLKSFGDMINAALWSMEINENNEIFAVNWSDGFRRKFGFENTEDFPNTVEAWSDRLHPEDKDATLDNFWKGIASKDTKSFVYDSKYRILQKNGEYCWYHAVGRMEDNGDGTRRMYGIIMDISADKKLEEQNNMLQIQQAKLEEAAALAEAANKAKTAFLNNMSHDIRTPMNAIMGFTDMATKNIDNKEMVSSCLKMTQIAGELLLSLINNILDMSHIESGKMTLEQNECDIEQTFENLEGTMQELAKKKNIALSFAVSDIKDRFVYCDLGRCNRIMINLVSNAIKYTNEGGRVDVTCKQIDGKDGVGTYQYVVADNGIGMSEEFRKRAFDEFAREKTATVSGIQGTGLGLSVCKTFVVAMGGKIECQSKLGEGTTFIVTLPFKLCEKAVLTAENSDNEANAAVEIDLRGKKVLLVEDNELNMEIATFMLQDEGMEVESANDGSVAVEMLRKNGPNYYDIVLMDIQMPIMDGYEATGKIREMYPDANIPIIALSANAFAEDKAASLVAGMNDHVAKPININELKAAMAKFI